LHVEDWAEKFEAGCRIWVNSSTGEVSSECPWAAEEKTEMPIQASEEFDGCGSLVYDSRELEEMFDYLDSVKK